MHDEYLKRLKLIAPTAEHVVKLMDILIKTPLILEQPIFRRMTPEEERKLAAQPLIHCKVYYTPIPVKISDLEL